MNSEVDISEVVSMKHYGMFCEVTLTSWSCSARARGVAEAAAIQAGADKAAFAARKNLLVGADSKLKLVRSKQQAMRNVHTRMTVPWGRVSADAVQRKTGRRVVPMALWQEYYTAMNRAQAIVELAVDDFVNSYPTLVRAAQAQLGTAYDVTEYPPAARIREYFTCGHTTEPIPDGSDFVGLPPTAIERLVAQHNDALNDCMAKAQESVWARVREEVSHINDRTADEETMKNTRNSLVENARTTFELCCAMATGSRLQHAANTLAQQLCEYPTEQLKQSEGLRKKIHTMTSELLAAGLLQNPGEEPQ